MEKTREELESAVRSIVRHWNANRYIAYGTRYPQNRDLSVVHTGVFKDESLNSEDLIILVGGSRISVNKHEVENIIKNTQSVCAYLTNHTIKNLSLVNFLETIADLEKNIFNDNAVVRKVAANIVDTRKFL